MKRRLLSIFTFSLCLLLASRVRAATKDACGLLSLADAQTALGEPVGPAKFENRSFGHGEATSCRFRPTVGKVIGGKSVSLEVRYSDDDLTGSAKGIAENFQSAGFKNVHQVSGIGTVAVWASNSVFGKLQGELTVIQGKSVMLIVLIDGLASEAEAISSAKIIATKALAKL